MWLTRRTVDVFDNPDDYVNRNYDADSDINKGGIE